MRTLVLILALGFAPGAFAVFKCVDEKGKTHIGDSIPDGCGSVVVYEVSRAGLVLRKIDPPLTPEQLKVRKEAQERQKEIDRAAAEQKRKDEALLQSFSNEREFDVVRDRQIEPLKSRINNAQERLKAIDKRQAEIADEMEFYKAGKAKKGAENKPTHPPHMLVAENERLLHEKGTLTRSIAESERTIVELRGKFDTDKKRWVSLKSAGASAAAAAGAGPAPAEKAAAEKAAAKK